MRPLRLPALAPAALVLAALLAGCGPSADAPKGPPAAADARPVGAVGRPATVVDTTTGDTLTVGAEQVDPTPVTIRAMEAGDRACYLTVTGPAGERTEMADVNFCERDDLVGQRVTLTTTPAQIQAASCEGDPECTETETVRLVIAADLAEAAADE